jgi:hypothetical protein
VINASKVLLVVVLVGIGLVLVVAAGAMLWFLRAPGGGGP